MAIEFEETTEPAGLEVYDSIEQRHVYVKTPTAVSVTPADQDRFCFPIDRACSITTDSLVFSQRYFVSVHDETGTCTQSLETGDQVRLGRGTQFVGLSGPIQLYCRVEEPGRVETRIDSIHVTFDRPVPVTIGARSLHDQPADTIQTPDDPASMIQAVSSLSSVLKTTSPERAWPTLRGHPPLIERSDELEVPEEMASPETDVTFTIPPTYRHLYTIAPLSFYLGATIQPGSEPTLRTSQFEYALGVEERFEDDVARLLKRCFLLDCLVRTEGMYQYELYERNRLENVLPFDLAETYELSLSERLERYLEIPYRKIETYVPRWPLTAHVPATPESVELLPFIVNELGIVREPRGRIVDGVTHVTGSEAGLVRSAGVDRSPSEPSTNDPGPFVVPDVNDESIEHAWFGDHVPQTASKAMIEAYRSQLSRGSRSESIEILLVCNDARMIDEHDLLDQAYGKRDLLPFDVTSEFGVGTDQLADLLTDGGYDFLHFIGHATPDGLECPDGDLDVRTLEEVNVGVFFLNACRSYEQGLALVRRGAFGGVSTLSDVLNEHAVEIGETMARLLNLGFPLRGALEIARENLTVGDQYAIVGDGSADIAQTEGGAPAIVVVNDRENSQFEFAIRSYPTKEFKLGTTTASNLQSVADRHLSPCYTPFSRVSEKSLQEYLTWTGMPVLTDDELRWNDGIGPMLFN
ncbi:hypothetical protein [Natronobeatus ordinarius]|uniref:hypothetical protein n=1 Tax=Natronobeatus ordinarius TaxID=2963433 RepID=UPI0020CBE65F|nr:hypothetical protein [Natronobeatus ordinarius]